MMHRVMQAAEVVTKLTAATFNSVALDSSKGVLVFFGAPWCGEFIHVGACGQYIKG